MWVTGFRQQVFRFVEDLPAPQPNVIERAIWRTDDDGDPNRCDFCLGSSSPVAPHRR
jgi:hypothetical protein